MAYESNVQNTSDRKKVTSNSLTSDLVHTLLNMKFTILTSKYIINKIIAFDHYLFYLGTKPWTKPEVLGFNRFFKCKFVFFLLEMSHGYLYLTSHRKMHDFKSKLY